MKKFKALTFAFAFLFVIGFSACTEDETLAEMRENIELKELSASDENGKPPPPPPPAPGGNN